MTLADLISNLGIYIVAPALSTVTAGFLVWFGKTHFKTIKALEKVELRQENHADQIQENMEKIEKIQRQVLT